MGQRLAVASTATAAMNAIGYARQLAMDALNAAPHPAPHTLPTPGPAPQTVGLLPTHCPPALDSPALVAAYAQSGFAYMDVSAVLVAE